MIRRFWRLHVLLVLGCVLRLGCAAQQSGAQAAADAAQATVARLSYLEGNAQVTPVNKTVEPVDAALNMPLWPGQSIRTESNGSAEIEFPDGSVLRVTENSAASILRFQPETQIGLDDGLYYLELRAGTQAQFSVFAGELSIVPIENASFRVLVRNNQPEIAVLSGGVSVTRANSYTVDLSAGESLRTDPKNDRRYLLSDGIAPEPWDHWNETRAQQLQDASADQTIARDDYAGDRGYGWSDLDADGSWYAMPGEGLVWQPYGVDAGWEPYGYGSWVYGSAGYVWASGYSWGWLPYQCGQWSYFNSFGWGWQPAYGCRTFGGGFPGRGRGWPGGFPVSHPPRGWHPPLPPPVPIAGGLGIAVKRPTLPVRPMDGPPLALATGTKPRIPQPVQVGGVALRPLQPVHAAPVSSGASAVGSALRHDFPVQPETHRSMLGIEANTRPAVPGRTETWRSVSSGSVADSAAKSDSVNSSPSGAYPPAWRRSETTGHEVRGGSSLTGTQPDSGTKSFPLSVPKVSSPPVQGVYRPEPIAPARTVPAVPSVPRVSVPPPPPPPQPHFAPPPAPAAQSTTHSSPK